MAMRWIATLLALVGLSLTNPDESAARFWLIERFRERVETVVPPGGSFQSLVGAAVSAAAPSVVEESVLLDRRNYLLFSVYSVLPQGALALTLEISGNKSMARNGLCLVGIATTFLPCNAAASAWMDTDSAIIEKGTER